MKNYTKEQETKSLYNTNVEEPKIYTGKTNYFRNKIRRELSFWKNPLFDLYSEKEKETMCDELTMIAMEIKNHAIN